MKPFLTIGLIGLFITGLINVMLVIGGVEDSVFNFAYYIVWIVFLIIGIGQMISKRIKSSA